MSTLEGVYPAVQLYSDDLGLVLLAAFAACGVHHGPKNNRTGTLVKEIIPNQKYSYFLQEIQHPPHSHS